LVAERVGSHGDVGPSISSAHDLPDTASARRRPLAPPSAVTELGIRRDHVGVVVGVVKMPRCSLQGAGDEERQRCDGA
jgi:hypothetical protein